MNPEQRYQIFTGFKYKFDTFLLNNYYDKDSPFLNSHDYQKISSRVIQDALDFYKIDLETFWKCTEMWPSLEAELWKKSKNPVEFYKMWNDLYSLANTCANINNQLLTTNIQRIVAHFFFKPGAYVDFGCGTATLSLGLKINNWIGGNLVLLDIPNDVQKFVKYRISRYNLNNEAKYYNVLTFNENAFSDGLLCIDVLEHIENSSEIFIKKIAPLIKKGGLLIMRAPWRGQLTHIDRAADDFYNCGGRSYLSSNFIEILRFGVNDIACVYRKL